MTLTWEAVSAISALVSALIVAIAAGAALLQLRHLRAGNQLVAILRIYDDFNSPAMSEARLYCTHELEKMLADPAVAASMATRGEIDPRALRLGNFLNEVGMLAVDGFLDTRLLIPLVPATARLWRILAPVAYAWRAQREDPVWADFEYIAALEDTLDRKRYIGRYPAWFRARLARGNDSAVAEPS